MFSQFNKVDTIDKLQKVNIEYIKGKTNTIPHNDCPMNEYSNLKKSVLVKLNKKGFITFNGRNYLNEMSFKKEEEYDFGIWTFWQQKPYITGYIQTEKLKNIINTIDKNINYVFINKDNKRISNSEKKIFYSRCRQSLFRNRNNEQKWYGYTFDSVSLFSNYNVIIEFIGVNKKLEEKLYNDYSYVEFSYKKYNFNFDIGNYILNLIK